MRRTPTLIGILALACMLAATSADAAPATWRTEPSPSVPDADNVLNGVAAVPGTHTTWAVGYVQRHDGMGTRPLALLRTGATWTVMPTADVPSGRLETVSAVKRGSAWAAGYVNISANTTRPLVMRWHGGQWQRTPVAGKPNAGAITGIAALASDDVWAVGTWGHPGPCGLYSASQMIQHWDGRRWSEIAPPSIPGATQSELTGLARIPGTTGLVAVGDACVGDELRAVVETYDPAAGWTIAQLGLPGDQGRLRVAARSATDIMVVGAGFTPSGETLYSAHFDGSTWTSHEVPEPEKTTASDLRSVAAVPGTSDYVATGFRHTHAGSRPFIVRWDGSAWSVMDTPDGGRRDRVTYGIAAGSPTDMTAVGAAQPADDWTTLVLRYR